MRGTYLRLIRLMAPIAAVLVWLAISAVGGPYFGRLAEVVEQSGAGFLPASAESTKVSEIRGAANADANPPAILLYHDPDGIAAATRAEIDAQFAELRALQGVAQASPLLPAREVTEAGEPLALQAFVVLNGDPREAVNEVRELTSSQPAGVEAYVTGPAGLVADLSAAFAGIDGLLLLVAVIAVLIILVIVYRSPVLPFVVLLSSAAALGAAIVAVYYMAEVGWITIDAQAQGILFILVIGAATDYALLLVARYRQELREHDDPHVALRKAWRGTVEPVLASGATVIAGLLCLLFSDLNSNKAVGPVAASGIVFAMLSALTFLPAMLSLTGRRVFYPSVPRLLATSEVPRGAWATVGALVARRPRTVWVGTLVVLLAGAAFVPQLRATGVPESEFVLGYSEARAGEEIRERYFVAGGGTPTIVLGSPERSAELLAAVVADPGVASAAITVSASPIPGRVDPDAQPQLLSFEGRDWLEIQVTLVDAEASDEAIETVRRLRTAVADVDATALVGGGTAIDLDTRDTARADIFKIIPLVLLVITALLALLLRSLLAPLLLVATTVISYLTTLGVAALVFNHLFGFPGADPSVPLFGFVFLVALGIDYNIFLASRIREESLEHGTRQGVLRGLRFTGNVITSAGVVLAATFAALGVIPIMFMLQLAFIVAFGVLLDTLVVRSLLVPGLLYDLGSRVWWPSRLSRSTRGEATAPPHTADGRTNLGQMPSRTPASSRSGGAAT